MMRSRARTSALLAALALWPAGRTHALGLRSSFKELTLEGLEPGRARKARLRVENTGGEEVDVEMRLEKPRDAELKDGYEPLPDPSWVRLTAPRRVLKAGGAGGGEAVVAVPAGEDRRGKRWQVQWVSAGKSPEGLRLELRSSLLLKTAGPPGPRRAPSGPGEREAPFAVLPQSGRASDVALGRTVDLRREHGVALKLSNLGSRKEKFKIAVVESPPEELLAEESPPGPDPAFLRLSASTLEVEPGKMAEAGLALNVPDQSRYRSRRWLFVVSVEPLEAAGRKTFYRLFVTTRKEEPKP